MRRKPRIGIKEWNQLISYFVIALNRMAMKRRANIVCVTLVVAVFRFLHPPDALPLSFPFSKREIMLTNTAIQERVKLNSLDFTQLMFFNNYHHIVTHVRLCRKKNTSHFALVGRIDVLMRCARDNIMSGA